MNRHEFGSRKDRQPNQQKKAEALHAVITTDRSPVATGQVEIELAWVAASVDRTIIPPTAVVMPLAALFGLAFGFIRNEEIFKGAIALALEDES